MILRHRVPSLATTLVLAAFAAQSALVARASKADERAGALLFEQQDCAHCHGPVGSGKKGPPLTNLHNNKEWPAERIARQIRNGGFKMPPFGDSLTDAQIAQLVAYLRAKHMPAPAAAAPPPSAH